MDRLESIPLSDPIDLKKRELLNRASVLMVSALLAIRYELREQCSSSLTINQPRPISPPLREEILFSTVNQNNDGAPSPAASSKSQTTSILKNTTSKIISHGSRVDKLGKRITFAQLQKFSVELKEGCLSTEDVRVHKALTHLSMSLKIMNSPEVNERRSSCGSKEYNFMEVKAGCILSAIIGSSLSCWSFFLYLHIVHFLSLTDENRILNTKVANVFVHCLTFLNPLVCGFSHQPTRATIIDCIRNFIS